MGNTELSTYLNEGRNIGLYLKEPRWKEKVLKSNKIKLTSGVY